MGLGYIYMDGKWMVLMAISDTWLPGVSVLHYLRNIIQGISSVLRYKQLVLGVVEHKSQYH